jgi:transposase
LASAPARSPAGGSNAGDRQRGPQAPAGPVEADALRAQVLAQPDATLADHCRRWAAEHHVTVSVATMSRAFRRLGITLKKSPAGG